MGLLTELRAALAKLSNTLHEFDADLTQLERTIDDHFSLNGKITPKMMDAIEKELKQ
jgi:hypothetical protein